MIEVSVIYYEISVNEKCLRETNTKQKQQRLAVETKCWEIYE
jgi:Holliday junction resolvasome RuvABC DNA-binding subunit